MGQSGRKVGGGGSGKPWKLFCAFFGCLEALDAHLELLLTILLAATCFYLLLLTTICYYLLLTSNAQTNGLHGARRTAALGHSGILGPGHAARSRRLCPAANMRGTQVGGPSFGLSHRPANAQPYLPKPQLSFLSQPSGWEQLQVQKPCTRQRQLNTCALRVLVAWSFWNGHEVETCGPRCIQRILYIKTAPRRDDKIYIDMSKKQPGLPVENYPRLRIGKGESRLGNPLHNVGPPGMVAMSVRHFEFIFSFISCTTGQLDFGPTPDLGAKLLMRSGPTKTCL